MVTITSPSNARIKRLAALQDRSDRDRERLFVVEGNRLYERALAAGLRPVEIYFDPARFDPGDLDGVEAHPCAPRALSRASYRDEDEGVIAVFPQFETGLERVSPGSAPLVLIAEGLEKPGNLGAILRTADAVGADAVIAVGESVDLFNPNVLRASTGAVFSVPVAISGLPEAVEWLRERSVTLFAADPLGEIDMWQADFEIGCALLVGSESSGLSREARAAADHLVSIPMTGATDSLNASVTMALLAYEAIRQRRGG